LATQSTERTGRLCIGRTCHIFPSTPGERVEAALALPAMSLGYHEVEFDLVSEYVAWFKTLGSNSLNLTIDVTELGADR
jgi:hypothetical protein